MLDTDLLVTALRNQGHVVEHVHKIPDNAGAYEFTIDGNLYTLDQARALLALDIPDATKASQGA